MTDGKVVYTIVDFRPAPPGWWNRYGGDGEDEIITPCPGWLIEDAYTAEGSGALTRPEPDHRRVVAAEVERGELEPVAESSNYVETFYDPQRAL